MIIRTGTSSDIAGILALQSKNLLTNLAEAELASGFVTTPFTPAQLETLLRDNGMFVACEDDRIAGYALAGSWNYYSQWPIFPYMVSRFPRLNLMGRDITEENSFQYGPICIDHAFRGSGLFQGLFEQMRLGMVDRYPIGVTFINRLNLRSYAAHTKKLGMQVIDEFEFGGRSFYGLAFDTQSSVLAK